MSGTITTSELLNAANWEYYQSPYQIPTGLTPILNSTSLDPNASSPTMSWEAAGMNAEVFQVTGTSQYIVAFEGTNVDPSSPAYTTEFATGSAEADLAILDKAAPADIPAMTDATTFLGDVETTLGIGSAAITVTGHSLGAAIASYISFTDSNTGVGFASPGLAFTGTGTGTFTTTLSREMPSAILPISRPIRKAV